MTQTPRHDDMSVDGFADLVDLHGPDAERWPAAVRPAALALLAWSEEARLVLEGARLTEELLLALPQTLASDALRQGIAAIPQQNRVAISRPAGRGALLAARILTALRHLRQNARPNPLSSALASGMAAAVIGFIMGANGLTLTAMDNRHPPAAPPSAATQLASAIDDMALEQTP